MYPAYPKLLSHFLRSQYRNGIVHSRAYSSTANEAEVAHFSRLSSQWWDEQGQLRPLHQMNPVRMKFIRDKLLETRQSDNISEMSNVNILDGMDVIDVGCGGGLLSESLARLGGRTLAIDVSKSNIEIATSHANRDPKLTADRLEYRHTSAEDLLEEPGMASKFDVVCSLEVVEHVDHPAEFLRSLASLTKPGGHLFISTVARTPLSYLLIILLAENVFKIVTPGTHTHSKFINPDEMLRFYKDEVPWISRLYNGKPTRIEAELRGLTYLPWVGKWILLPKYVPGSLECDYIFWVRRPLASTSNLAV